jgi:REP element-mobilizing transposase RayT
MAEKFMGKYRIGSVRRPNWDYAGNGQYFITLVVQGRNCIFGEIEHKIIRYNNWGKIVIDEWNKSFDLRDELICEAFVLMPNHLHAIIRINKMENLESIESHGRAIQTPSIQTPSIQTPSIQTPSIQTPSIQTKEIKQEFRRKPKSVSSFIAGFKSAVTTQINNFIDQNQDENPNPEIGKFNRKNRLWQANYHDHIIHNSEEYQHIQTYIVNNPAKWDEDKLRENK